jgi:hypothetical protein
MKLFFLSGGVLERWLWSRDKIAFTFNQNRTSDSGLTNQTRVHFWLSACFELLPLGLNRATRFVAPPNEPAALPKLGTETASTPEAERPHQAYNFVYYK